MNLPNIDFKVFSGAKKAAYKPNEKILRKE